MEYFITAIAKGLQLGEGCIWDNVENQIHYLDIKGHKIYSYSLENGDTEELDMGDYVGCIVLQGEGKLIAAVRNRLVRVNLQTKECKTLMQIEQPDYMRFNDGKCDNQGNLWVGTMAIDQSHPKAAGAGKLYCIREKKILSQYDGFTIANGLAWNEKGDRFYHIDTVTQKIDVYDVTKEGVLSNKRTAVAIDKSEGAPDGMCMDKNGHLWVAMWGGAKVCCYNPENGMKLKEVAMPDRNVSCCSIVGSTGNLLCVTTAQDETENGGNVYLIEQKNTQKEWC